VAPNPISAALCDRGEGPQAKANALDKFDPIPPIWRDTEVDKLQLWLEAPMCPEPSEEQARLYRARQLILDRLNRRLERARVTEEMGVALEPFRGWRPSAGWPGSFHCGSCAALWASADRVGDIAARWPRGTSTKVGDRLDKAVKREPLVSELCGLQPPPDARAEIERRFRYFSWTADGAKLFEVAALFQRPEIIAGCSGR
jgi:hypothetical protein